MPPDTALEYRLRRNSVVGPWLGPVQFAAGDQPWSLEFATVQVTLTNDGTTLGDPHKVEVKNVGQFTSGDVFHVPPDTPLEYRLRRNSVVGPWLGPVQFAAGDQFWSLEFATVQVGICNDLDGTTPTVEVQNVAQFADGDVFHVPPATDLQYRLRRGSNVDPWQTISFGAGSATWSLNCDVDTDGDGTPDHVDSCPLDPDKVELGVCGCGIADIDSDGDGVFDCADNCPLDPDKAEPGVCGCGIADIDSDDDGAPDCIDACPVDPGKVEPGVCGCGVLDVDSDGDGLFDCADSCPTDPDKAEPGVCGCGVPDVDSDGDGVFDCADSCPVDPDKVESGVCGCGVPDIDSDGDGVFDCVDNCPLDLDKVEPGVCGCGVPDSDNDGDGMPDCDR